MPKPQPPRAATIVTDKGEVAITMIGQDTDHSVAWNLKGSAHVLAGLLPGLVIPQGVEWRVMVQVVVIVQREVQ